MVLFLVYDKTLFTFVNSGSEDLQMVRHNTIHKLGRRKATV